ncbi:uncharacterized protein LOC135397707 [Ornithodoros turicata]|uniref:uncharacterized protein LOC135397707 n=1 Tax=Ornithodoros turicata TaxID=34597 RepID=UPI0031399D75
MMGTKIVFTLVLMMGFAAVVSGNAGANLMEIVKAVIDQKITDPELAKAIKAKLPEVQGCVMILAQMKPEAVTASLDAIWPELNTCGQKAAGVDSSMMQSTFKACMMEAQTSIKKTVELSEEDGKAFDEGMNCVASSIGM